MDVSISARSIRTSRPTPLGQAHNCGIRPVKVRGKKMALPTDFGLMNYGIRSLEIGNGQIFLGTASNMLAPDPIADSTFWPPALKSGPSARPFEMRADLDRSPDV